MGSGTFAILGGAPKSSYTTAFIEYPCMVLHLKTTVINSKWQENSDHEDL
jgi:hypothetical protein